MTKCPKCGKEVPEKGWTMAGKPDKTGTKTDVTFGMCEECALILILKLRKSQNKPSILIIANLRFTIKWVTKD